MNFGEKLKQLRQSRNWSQPELAEAIGIEQSYLSKLENDKSVPSPDMLNRILEAFDIDLDTLLEGMDESEIRNQLRSIPQVNGHLQAQKELAQKKGRRWFIGSALMCVMGISMIVGGISTLNSPYMIYDYTSDEIVPMGENNETFESLESFLQREFAPVYEELVDSGLEGDRLTGASNNEFEKLRYQYSSLNSDDFHYSHFYQGQNFVREVTDEQDLINLQAVGRQNGGTRIYELYNTRTDPDMEATAQGMNGMGVFLLALGMFGFLLERRYYKNS